MDQRTPKIFRFVVRVLRDFFGHNHGLLLTAAVAQNMMLSLIPLSAVLVVGFSHFMDRDTIIATISAEIALIAPSFAPVLTESLVSFLDRRQIVGWLGILTLLAFSSMAFRVLEDAIFIIFHRPMPSLKRKFWISALMPYFFIGIVAVGLIFITAINALIDGGGLGLFDLLGVELLLERHVNFFIYVTSLTGLVLLFTLFYKIMPVANVPFRRALVGGLTATTLWEIVRHLLVSYYTTRSMLNVVYGSLATVVIVILTLEAIALILLLGAQVIADLQRSAEAGVTWHEDPKP